MATLVNHDGPSTTTRVVVVDSCGPLVRGALQALPEILMWPAKDPGDTLDYVIDYSEALAGDSGDAISTLDVTTLPNATGDVVLTRSAADGSQAVLWLTNGQAGTTYSIKVAITTNNGRALSRTVYLPVTALSVSSSSGSALTDQNGAALTDQTGATITT